jgi:hypothetical protein
MLEKAINPTMLHLKGCLHRKPTTFSMVYNLPVPTNQTILPSKVVPDLKMVPCTVKITFPSQDHPAHVLIQMLAMLPVLGII